MANDIHDEKWLKKIIDEAIQHVLNENKTKEEHRALSAEDLRNYGIEYLNAKEFGADGIARALLFIYESIKQNGAEPADFYCGITNDIVKRKEEHEQNDYDGNKIELIIALQCADMKTAADTEFIMHKRYGFYMGETETYANGAAPDSDYVYIYRIPK